MADEAPPTQAPPADGAGRDPRTRSCSRRPSAARPTSCSTRAPTDELDAMRHSTAHVMAEAVLDLFPGTQLGIGPAIEDGFYYDFKLDRPLTPADLAAIEERMAASVAADHPFVRRELPPEEGRAFFEEREPAVQGRDPRRPRREGEGDEQPDAADERLRARPVRRPVQGAPRREHRQDRARSSCSPSPARTGAATRSGHALQRIYGTVWADAGGARRVPVAARGGEEARPPPARRPARPVQLPRRLARARRSGIRRASGSGGRSRARCASSRPAAATTRSARRSS